MPTRSVVGAACDIVDIELAALTNSRSQAASKAIVGTSFWKPRYLIEKPQVDLAFPNAVNDAPPAPA